jgi:tryptophan-rich sensory protein
MIDRNARTTGKKWLALAASVLLVALVSALGSLVTLPKIPTWYASLAKPSFNPPSWIFGPVWTTLYLAMAIAAWRVWLHARGETRHIALRWYLLQLALNAIWSPVFFGMQKPALALGIVVALFVAIVMTMARFFPIDRAAGWLLCPYLAWVGFASVLNGAIVMLN